MNLNSRNCLLLLAAASHHLPGEGGTMPRDARDLRFRNQILGEQSPRKIKAAQLPKCRCATATCGNSSPDILRKFNDRQGHSRSGETRLTESQVEVLFTIMTHVTFS